MKSVWPISSLFIVYQAWPVLGLSVLDLGVLGNQRSALRSRGQSYIVITLQACLFGVVPRSPQKIHTLGATPRLRCGELLPVESQLG